MINTFLDKIFGFMLNWNATYAIIALSLLMALIMVLSYKWMTDQKEMKQLKEDLQNYQKKMKETKDKPEKLMEIQKEAMSVNMKYMGKSMKPTLITFIPIILIFSWMNTHFTYEPLMPEKEFELTIKYHDEITGNATIKLPEGITLTGEPTQEIKEHKTTYKLKGTEGKYYATIESNGQEIDKEILITNTRNYAPITQAYNSEIFETAELNNQTLQTLWGISWFWTYLIFAIVFSTILRKVMKVY